MNQQPQITTSEPTTLVDVPIITTKSTTQAHVPTKSSDQVDQISVPISEIKTEPSYAFQIQAFANIFAVASSVFLVIGLLLLLSMTVGVHYIPIMATMGASVSTGLMISGFVSAATGGFGLASSYYNASRFFKKAPKVVDSCDQTREYNNTDLVV